MFIVTSQSHYIQRDIIFRNILQRALDKADGPHNLKGSVQKDDVVS